MGSLLDLTVRVKNLIAFRQFLNDRGIRYECKSHASYELGAESETWELLHEGKIVGDAYVRYVGTHSLQMPIIGRLLADAFDGKSPKLEAREAEDLVRKKLEEEIPEALRGYWEVPLVPVTIHLRDTASPDLISALRGYTDDYASKEIGEYIQSHFKEESLPST
jgi:hypothetical protein